MRGVKPFVTRLLIGFIGVAGCGGQVVVDAEGIGAGGAGGMASSGSLSGNVTSTSGNGPGSVTSTGAGTVTSTGAGTVTSTGAGSVTSTGSGGMCDIQTCPTVDIMGFITLNPCCPDTNPAKCGLDVTPISGFVGFPPGCMEVERPGSLNPSCPNKLLDVMGMMITLPGCCSGGMCGVFADFSGFAPGLNLGCADASDVVQMCGP